VQWKVPQGWVGIVALNQLCGVDGTCVLRGGDGSEGPEGDVLKFVISTIAVPTAEMLFVHLFTLQSALNSWQKLFHQLFRICVA